MLQRLDAHIIEISTLNEKINKLPFNNSVLAPSKMKKCCESEISLQKTSVSKPWVGIPISQLSNSDKDVKIESNSNLDSVSHVDKIEFRSLIQDSNNNMNSGAEDSDAGFQNVTIRRRALLSKSVYWKVRKINFSTQIYGLVMLLSETGFLKPRTTILLIMADLSLLNKICCPVFLNSCYNFKLDTLKDDLCNLYGDIDDYKFSILHLNARSLFHKIDDLVLFLSFFPIKFSVIFITETWLNERSALVMKFPGYEFVFNNRVNRKGVGVGMFISRSLNFETCYQDNLNLESIESVSVNVHLNRNRTIKLIAIYHPPNTNIDEFFKFFEIFLQNSGFSTYLVGDFNVDLGSYIKNKFNFEMMLSHYKFQPLINLPTRVSTFSSSVIDNILTNMDNSYNCGGVISDLSDHFPIFCLIKSNEEVSNNSTSTTCNFLHYDIPIIKNILSNFNWDQIIFDFDVDSSLNKFFEVFKAALDYETSTRTHFSSKFKKSWMNTNLLNLCKEKNRLYVKLVKNPSLINLANYKSARNHFTKMKRVAEKIFLNNLVKIVMISKQIGI
ncbi:hypothetical protein HELRODRAFT_178204 [Helobdella robusta]|uniref:Endonuclease/exonuclease/phosphatase domain-containing protein n=1 Tax=Helobdella robusta TaxID=6412 RepID=T1FCX9_HELRO|nr:hypothetical protein HELRODRAFT_178204 [Helobdella robusta]ESN97412.1 hypothetical protein HELRODRAFT_178204 [Helobdella robusta]